MNSFARFGSYCTLTLLLEDSGALGGDPFEEVVIILTAYFDYFLESFLETASLWLKCECLITL